MTAVEFAVQWAITIAQDESHGYDQINRQGPDYDCSSLVINAFDRAGIPVKANGATYTGNMKNAFIKSGFINVTGSVQLKTGAGLVRGDVLLRESGHAALHIGGALPAGWLFIKAILKLLKRISSPSPIATVLSKKK